MHTCTMYMHNRAKIKTLIIYHNIIHVITRLSPRDELTGASRSLPIGSVAHWAPPPHRSLPLSNPHVAVSDKHVWTDESSLRMYTHHPILLTALGRSGIHTRRDRVAWHSSHHQLLELPKSCSITLSREGPPSGRGHDVTPRARDSRVSITWRAR